MIKIFNDIEVKFLQWGDELAKNCVYMLIFPNAKYYIGQTNDLIARLRGHCSSVNAFCVSLHRAIKKYKSFECVTLKRDLTLEEMNQVEKEYIEKLGANKPENGYNLTSGGDNYKRNEETKKKMSESAKNRWKDEETKKKMSEAHKGSRGYKTSDETKKKLSEASTGRIHSEETKKKCQNPLKKDIAKKHQKNK